MDGASPTAIAVFLCALGALLYAVAVYPLLLFTLSRFIRKESQPPAQAHLRPVTIIIAVRDGARWIADKLKCIQDLDYPPELIEIVVVSDGSTDETEEIVAAVGDPRIRLISTPPLGKASALNRGIAAANNEILFLTDVRQRLDRQGLRNLVRWFEDPRVGVVSGELMIGGGQKEIDAALYWRYDKCIRKWLSEIAGLTGASGSIYAMRRDLACAIPPETLLDDVYLPIAAYRKSGCRLIMDKSAIAYDVEMPLNVEFSRKVRTQAGLFQIIGGFPFLMNPFHWFSFHFLSHKFVRLLFPYQLLALLICPLFMSPGWREAVLVPQLLVYLAALLDVWAHPQSKLKPLTSPCRTFLVLVFAAFMAVPLLFNKNRVWRPSLTGLPAADAGDGGSGGSWQFGRVAASLLLAAIAGRFFRAAALGAPPLLANAAVDGALYYSSTACLGLLVYAILLYPALLGVAVLIKRVFVRPTPVSRLPLPRISILVSAHNEEDVIAEKIANFAALSYPRELLQILVGCDGCTDRTADIIRECGDSGVTLLDFRDRTGKTSVLNRLAKLADADILFFSDANTIIEPDALLLVAERFSDRRVGCVAGNLRLIPTEEGQKSEAAYWKFEVLLKKLESELNMSLGASGSIYAIRRELYQELPATAIVDDFLISMNVRARGFRSVFDERIAAHEYTAASVREEFNRHVRIGAGNFHAVRHTWRMLLPTAGSIAFAYWSHKVLRWVAPFLTVLAFACSVPLMHHSLQASFAGTVVLFSALALIGSEFERHNVSRNIFAFPYYGMAVALAMVCGFARFLAGSQAAAWQRTARNR